MFWKWLLSILDSFVGTGTDESLSRVVGTDQGDLQGPTPTRTP